MTTTTAPTERSERITNLDTVRGLAVLGILLMNIVSFGLPSAAYFNLRAGGSNTALDYGVGIAGEVFIDQKMMGLFSALFGAGIVLFANRAEAKGRRPNLFSLWRNLLLGLIGLAHLTIWEGDVLLLYAACAPLLVVTRRFGARWLLGLGTVCVLGSAVIAILVQSSVPADGEGLGDLWLPQGGDIADGPGVAFLSGYFLRALGMMWIGVALYKMQIMQGHRPTSFYQRMAAIGLAIGLPLAILGVIVTAANDYSPDVAFIGQAPNTLATIPLSFAYLAIITLWDKRPTTEVHRRVRACGRMALTNYLTQTIIGITMLRVVFNQGDLGRTALLGMAIAVWVLQLAWSKPWLEHFNYGPFEWVWRSLTYRKRQTFARPAIARSAKEDAGV